MFIVGGEFKKKKEKNLLSFNLKRRNTISSLINIYLLIQFVLRQLKIVLV